MKAARFLAYQDLSGFNFAASEVNEALMRQLLRCEFMDAAENVVLIGGPGTVDQAQWTRHREIACRGRAESTPLA